MILNSCKPDVHPYERRRGSPVGACPCSGSVRARKQGVEMLDGDVDYPTGVASRVEQAGGAGDGDLVAGV